MSKSTPQTITKSEAARQAIAAGHAKPKAAVAYIKTTFGIDMTPTHFSAVKAVAGKKVGAKRKPGRPKATPAVTGDSSVNNGRGGDLLAAVESLKPLVKSLGADKVKRIVNLLSD